MITLRRNKRRVSLCLCITIIITSAIVLIEPIKTNSISPFFTLDALVHGGGVKTDYFNLLQQQLDRIGINLNIRYVDWSTFVYELIIYRDFDICYVGLQGGDADPDFTGVYDENGSLNLFGYDTSMDWDDELGTGKNEWYMKEGRNIMPPNSEERIQHYYDWQNHLMDNILPILPTFTPYSFEAIWSQLKGYNYSDGILQSWGKMSWETQHPGQKSTSEIVIIDAEWTDFNPVYQDDSSSIFITSATTDPLIWYDSDLSVWPHLAKSFTHINDTHVRIEIREGIKWADIPSWGFTDEFLDARDVYFTLFCWNNFISSDKGVYEWLEDMVIIDDYTLDIYIDGDSSTPENEPDVQYLPRLAIRILPEHFLNQTQNYDGTTPDVTHPSWNNYSYHGYGTGLFELTSYMGGVETILTVRPDCWRLNTSLTSDPTLDWEQRFGDFSGGLSQLRIRYIPDEQTSLLEFEAGKVDIKKILRIEERREEYDIGFDIQKSITQRFSFVAFNIRQERGILGNREPAPGNQLLTIGLAIRKAICHAINREEINQIIHNGEYHIFNTPIHPALGIWCNPDIIVYDYNLIKAKTFMEIAGYDIPGFTTLASNNLYSLTIIFAAAVLVLINRKKLKKHN